MANEDHVEILEQGVEAWNAWRKKNQDVRPVLNSVGLEGANLRWVDFSGADLRGVDLVSADLREARLRGANLGGTTLRGADLRGADLRRADLHVADIYRILREADQRRTRLSKIDLRGEDVSGVRLRWAGFNETDLSWADLYYSIFLKTDQRMVEVNRSGLRRGSDLSWADLGEDDLSGDDLASFLRGSDQRRTRLSRTNLDRANLRRVDLDSADLFEASLREADLRGADLSWADLRETGGGLLGCGAGAVQVLVDRGPADLELPRDVGWPKAVGSHAADLGDPSGGQRLAALVPASGLGPCDALDLPLAPEVVLELREHPEHGVEHLPHRGGGIDVLLGDVEADVALPQLGGDLDQVSERAPGFRCVGWLQASSGPLSFDQAARPKTWWTKARWAGMSLAGTARTCPLASIAIASTPASVRRAVQKL